MLESDKYIKFFRLFVAIALGSSLVMNFTLLSRLDQLENQVHSVSNNQHNIISNVNGQTSHIQSVLNDIKEEQSWLSTITMDLNTQELKDGLAEATFEWQVKELQNDSEVIFNYAYGDNEDYTAIPAKELQHGLFQVKVPIKFKIEPLWEVGLITTNSNNQQEMSKQEMEEKMAEEQRQNPLKYFVSVSYDDMVKSGNIQTEHLGHVGMNDYGIIQTDIHMDDENFDVTLIHNNLNNSSIVIEEVYLLKYEDKKFVEKVELESDDQNNPSDQDVHFFYLNQIKQYEDARLVIKVVYSNGETFKKEVY